LYKDLFDVKSSVKVDFKNIHPANVSQDVPIILSTNDDVLTVLRDMPFKRTSHFNTTNSCPVNGHSVTAAIRRLYLVPFRFGKYDLLHADIMGEELYADKLTCYNKRLE
jgi:hypothetical protein